MIVAGFLLLTGGGGGYRVSMTLENANQLVKGNLVKVGGVEVGNGRRRSSWPTTAARGSS